MIKKFFILLFSAFLSASAIATPIALPKNLIALASPQGIQLFNQSHSDSYFWNLNLQFVTQDNLAFCAIASSVMVLNALQIEAPIDPRYTPFSIFTQDNIFTPAVEKLVPKALVKKQGVTLDQIGQLLTGFPVKVKVIHSNKTSINQFRTLAKTMIGTHDGYIIVNFLRTPLGEKGFGHMSPLAAYDKNTDRFLVLDVARYRYPSVWIKTQELWNAMNTYDKTAKAYRGFVLISR